MSEMNKKYDLENIEILLQKFMVEDLNLKGTELVIYATIYKFTQGKDGYTGGIRFLEDLTRIGKRGVIKNLNKLMSKKLLTKRVFYKNNMRFTEYYAVNPLNSCGLTNVSADSTYNFHSEKYEVENE